MAQSQPQRLADFDQDGRLTVYDLSRLNAHLRGGTNRFAPALLPYADVNEDGKVDATDAQWLADAIVGRRILPNPVRPPGLVTPLPATDGRTITLAGDAPRGRRIVITGGATPIVLTNGANGRFTASIPLLTNRLNRLFLTATGGVFGASAVRTIDIVQDSQPPSLFIDFPTDGATLTTSNTVIAGRVGDMLSGYRGLEVFVNSQPANVDVGIGNNGTFERGNVPLNLGANPIIVTARDVFGNSVTKRITVLRMPLEGPRLLALEGDAQSTNIHRRLSQPVRIRVTQEDGVTPIVGKVVTFDVTRSDGRVLPVNTNQLAADYTTRPDASILGAMTIQLLTDTNGEASAWWTLGGDAGCGNNRVCVISRDISGTVFFCASAKPAPARQINIGSGNNQRAEAGGPPMEPIRAWVSDSCNGVEGIPVTFRVTQGGARFLPLPLGGGEGRGEGATSITVLTTRTGYAPADVTLGPDPGANVIEANYPGNPGLPATFTLYGVARDPGRGTSFTGLVFDNANQPIGGVDCRLTVNGQTFVVFSDMQGRFVFSNAPAGPGTLHVDGGPATRLNGTTIPVGSFPALDYIVLLVPNAENSLPMPVLLPRLNLNNARTWYGTNDITLTCEGMAGLKMIIKAGSMRKPDGSLVSPTNSAILSLNQVHHDDVPMPMPDGVAPPFAWTLQPGGAHFDPPIRIEYPNMSGLPAGAIANFLSYNHDTERFEIVASGHVTEDGSTILTDDGAGLSIAGWGCNCPPYAVTADVKNSCQLV